VDEANADLAAGISAIKKFSDQVEIWFDHSMDRVSGWYKRRTQFVLFLVAVVSAVLLNVDTVAISRSLGKNQSLRDSVVTVRSSGKAPEERTKDPKEVLQPQQPKAMQSGARPPSGCRPASSPSTATAPATCWKSCNPIRAEVACLFACLETCG
jgi:hypothetical protein